MNETCKTRGMLKKLILTKNPIITLRTIQSHLHFQMTRMYIVKMVKRFQFMEPIAMSVQ